MSRSRCPNRWGSLPLTGRCHREGRSHSLHGCDRKPADHPAPCSCRCGATTTKET
jgi:hypothetical protein